MNEEKRLALFIDFENIAIGIKEAKHNSSRSAWCSSGWSRRERSW